MIGDWIKRIRKKKKKPLEQQIIIPWIEAADNPWGVPVLDIRPLTHKVLSYSQNPLYASNAVSFGADDGTGFIGQNPPCENRVDVDLCYAKDRVLADGPLFTPSVMEHKWAIFFHAGKIICVRSWTRQVEALADVDQSGGEIHVSSIKGNLFGDNDPCWDSSRLFDYLIRSHALGLPFPVPIPEQMTSNPYSAALYCSTLFGNMAMFASPYDFVAEIPQIPLRSDSLLHIAAAKGNRAEIDRQLEKGIPMDLFAGDGMSPLHWALAQDDISVVKHLIDRGAQVDVPSDQGATPLMTAVQGYGIEKVSFLLDQGADPNAKDTRGFTALHRTCEAGSIEMTKLLIEHGADKEVEAQGHTPLSLATQNGETAVVDLLQR